VIGHEVTLAGTHVTSELGSKLVCGVTPVAEKEMNGRCV
jgi:hypothetical protein